MFNDCEGDVLTWSLSTVRLFMPQPAYDEVTPLASWPDTPSTYLLGTKDRIISQEWARAAVAARLGRPPIDLPTGHCPSEQPAPSGRGHPDPHRQGAALRTEARAARPSAGVGYLASGGDSLSSMRFCRRTRSSHRPNLAPTCGILATSTKPRALVKTDRRFVFPGDGPHHDVLAQRVGRSRAERSSGPGRHPCPTRPLERGSCVRRCTGSQATSSCPGSPRNCTIRRPRPLRQRRGRDNEALAVDVTNPLARGASGACRSIQRSSSSATRFGDRRWREHPPRRPPGPWLRPCPKMVVRTRASSVARLEPGQPLTMRSALAPGRSVRQPGLVQRVGGQTHVGGVDQLFTRRVRWRRPRRPPPRGRPPSPGGPRPPRRASARRSRWRGDLTGVDGPFAVEARRARLEGRPPVPVGVLVSGYGASMASIMAAHAAVSTCARAKCPEVPRIGHDGVEVPVDHAPQRGRQIARPEDERLQAFARPGRSRARWPDLPPLR